LVLPKGNPLIEKVTLPFTDINTMLNNLEQEKFTGYVKLELAKSTGVFFYLDGNMLRAVEIDDTNVKVNPPARIVNRTKNREVNTSTYVLSPRIIEVLALNFAFQPLYLDYEVRKKELKKVMNTLESNLYTGIIEFRDKDSTRFVLLDRGELVTDFFASEYGEIIAGTESVSKYLDMISKEGAVINIYAERHEEIINRRKAIEEEMDKIKQLIIKEEKGWSLLKSGDIFWIDEYIFEEWGLDAKSINLELETPDGMIHVVKVQPNKKMGGYISTIGANIKKMGLNEDDLVSVKPII
jgi:hypothetical protein